ncbi:MAG: sulfatase-like hydrolase/transferase [Vicinamibacterales bacterium]
MTFQPDAPARHPLGLLAAAWLLNAALTFRSVWPTPAVHWQGEASVELAVALLGVGLVTRGGRPVSARLLRLLASVWVLLALSRYADVTAPALYGREVNLYWDTQHLSKVVGMLSRVATWWQISLLVSTIGLALGLFYGASRWAWRRVSAGLGDAYERRALVGVAAIGLSIFAAQHLTPYAPSFPPFAAPIVGSYVHQARLVGAAVAARHGAGGLPDSPRLDSDLSLIRGVDVMVIFVEAYGAVAFDDPAAHRALAADRADLDAALAETHRQVVSGFSVSPTFGGSSWLAHLSLLSGIEVRDASTNAELMAQDRDSMIKAFARRGYRTVAIMPGLQQAWPEGAFYGFDEIYGTDRLDYHGPPFGWWAIPDQYAFAKLDALEVAKPGRAPLLVFFPTISTHVPFTPAPPYQPNWPRLLTAEPYELADLDAAYAQAPDWLNLAPSYQAAVSYTYRTLAGYLRERGDHDFVLVVLGDHQPLAAVSGEGAAWDVPVHVIASRPEVLARLRQHGFTAGLAPVRPVLGPMHALLPMLLDAFGNAAAR